MRRQSSGDDLPCSVIAAVIELQRGLTGRLILAYKARMHSCALYQSQRSAPTLPWCMTSWRTGWQAWWTGPVPGSSGLWSPPSARPGRSHHRPPSSSSWECLADGPEHTWDRKTLSQLSLPLQRLTDMWHSEKECSLWTDRSTVAEEYI